MRHCLFLSEGMKCQLSITQILYHIDIAFLWYINFPGSVTICFKQIWVCWWVIHRIERYSLSESVWMIEHIMVLLLRAWLHNEFIVWFNPVMPRSTARVLDKSGVPNLHVAPVHKNAEIIDAVSYLLFVLFSTQMMGDNESYFSLLSMLMFAWASL